MKHVLKGALMRAPGKTGIVPRHRNILRLSFGLILLLVSQLICTDTSAIPLPTISFNCTQPRTPTTVCTGPTGWFASGWTAPGAYWEWTVNTTGYQNVMFLTATSSSATGPATGTLQYNIGGGFIPVATIPLPGTGCIALAFPLPPACNNKPLVTVRMYMTGAASPAGTNRVREMNVFDAMPIPPVDTFSFGPVTINQEYDATTNSLLNRFGLHYNYLSANHPTQYLNLFVRDPATGNKIWAAENLALTAYDTTTDVQYEMPLQALFAPGQPVSTLGISLFITSSIMVSPSMPPDTMFHTYVTGSDTLAIGPGGIEDSISATPTDTISYINAWFAGGADSVIEHRRMPNIDLDSGTYKPDSAYAGDWNACGPASCANSMQWLENEKKVKFDSVLTHRAKLRALSKQMGRANKAGVQGRKLVEGKLGFVDRYKLPIVVRFQDNFISDSIVRSPDTTYKHYARNENRNRKDANKNHIGWDFLWQEMKLDKDVEIWMVNKNMETSRWEGFSHYVVVTEVSWTKGVMRLKYKEDARQDRGGNGDLREVTVTIDTTTEGFPYIKERDDKPGPKLLKRTFIVGIYSEGLDTNIKYTAMKPAAVPEFQEGKTLKIKVFNNPMNDYQPLTVQFDATAGEQLQVEIRDITGRLVKSWSGATQTINMFTWNGDTNAGKTVSAGIYMIRIHTDSATSTIKVVKE